MLHPCCLSEPVEHSKGQLKAHIAELIDDNFEAVRLAKEAKAGTGVRILKREGKWAEISLRVAHVVNQGWIASTSLHGCKPKRAGEDPTQRSKRPCKMLRELGM